MRKFSPPDNGVGRNNTEPRKGGVHGAAKAKEASLERLRLQEGESPKGAALPREGRGDAGIERDLTDQ